MKIGGFEEMAIEQIIGRLLDAGYKWEIERGPYGVRMERLSKGVYNVATRLDTARTSKVTGYVEHASVGEALGEWASVLVPESEGSLKSALREALWNDWRLEVGVIGSYSFEPHLTVKTDEDNRVLWLRRSAGIKRVDNFGLDGNSTYIATRQTEWAVGATTFDALWTALWPEMESLLGGQDLKKTLVDAEVMATLAERLLNVGFTWEIWRDTKCVMISPSIDGDYKVITIHNGRIEENAEHLSIGEALAQWCQEFALGSDVKEAFRWGLKCGWRFDVGAVDDYVISTHLLAEQLEGEYSLDCSMVGNEFPVHGLDGVTKYQVAEYKRRTVNTHEFDEFWAALANELCCSVLECEK